MYGRPAEGCPNSGLTRYGSAPGSLLASLADSVISEDGASAAAGFRSLLASGSGSDPLSTLPMTRFFAGYGDHNSPSSLTSESSCGGDPAGPTGLQRSSSDYHQISGVIESNNSQAAAAAAEGGAHLMRHSSSPAGFFSHLVLDNGQLSLSLPPSF